MKKTIIKALIPLLISMVLFAIFVIGGIATNIKSGPEKVINKMEKVVKKGDIKGYYSLFSGYGNLDVQFATTSDLPFYGQNPNFIFEGTEEGENSNDVYVNYTIVYEEDGLTKQVSYRDHLIKSDNRWVID